jgi:hypothetical protein
MAMAEPESDEMSAADIKVCSCSCPAAQTTPRSLQLIMSHSVVFKEE